VTNPSQAHRKRILLADDEPLFGRATAGLLQQHGYKVHWAEDGPLGLAALADQAFDLVISDLNMPGNRALEFLSQIRRLYPAMPVIVLTGQPTLPTAIESVRLGVHDYLLKPIEIADLQHSIQRALERGEQPSQVGAGIDRIVGTSPATASMKQLAARIAASNANVLVTGECGTGKDMLAEALHEQSQRSQASFVKLDCTAWPESLLELELFGQANEAGNESGGSKPALVTVADRGTIFLDAIGELPLALQAKLLRLVQYGSFVPVGGCQELRTNVRIISATDRDLSRECEQGRFRHDLYYRLAVLEVRIPPLRERLEDIPILAANFLRRIAVRDGISAKRLSRAAAVCLMRHSWPGNVRELINIMERCGVLASGPVIELADLPPDFGHSATAAAEPEPARSGADSELQGRRVRLRRLDQAYLSRLMKRHRGNITQAAREAGLTRQGLHKALGRVGIRAGDFRQR